MATSIISAGDAANLGVQTTGGDDGVLVLRSGAAGAKVDALSIAAVGTGAFVGEVTATGFTGTLDGVLGGGTPAAATVTTFTSNGIDDNADAVAITINSSENVGIGTSSPASRLNVVGNIGIGTLTGDNAYNPTSSSLIIQGGNQSGLSTYTAVGNSTSTGLISYYSDSSGGFTRYLDIVAIGSSTSAGSNIRFLTGAVSATERMRIDTSGNVGIGTASPSTKLHVAGDVTVAGAVTGVTSINSGQIGGRRNIVYNGEMKVAQRSASETGLGAAAGYFTLDRWRVALNGTVGRFTMAQVADGPPGFANCMKLTTTTADTSIAAGEYLIFETRFEGQDLQQLKKGTASAEQFTVSFYVKGNAAALYVCEIYDVDNSRNITQSFAVTTSWNRIELTFAADTSDPLDDDNAVSIALNFWLHSGSDHTGGTFAVNTWNDVTAANRAAVDGLTSIFDATSRTFFITGVQMEIGATATEFEHRTFGEELALCQRYYEVMGIGSLSGVAATTSIITCSGSYVIQKRAAPTAVLLDTTPTFFQAGTGVKTGSSSAIASSVLGVSGCRLDINGFTGLTVGKGQFSNSADMVSLESEL